MQFMGLHSPGNCHTNTEGPNGNSMTPELDRILSGRRDGLSASFEKEAEFMAHNYKFYLSFENGNCRGYVSEKLPKALIWNLVPVIGGPVDGYAHVPNRNAAIYTEVKLWPLPPQP